MGFSHEPELGTGANWEGLMRQVATCELPYEEALKMALECVAVAERYPFDQWQLLSPADPNAKSAVVTKLASALECNVRLAVYSLYHGEKLIAHDEAVEQLVNCGKRSDARV
jgi:hypothetical protein